MGLLRHIWKKILVVTAIAAGLLGFFALIELIRAYQVLAGLHPWLGGTYLVLLILLLMFLVAYYVHSVLFRRKILIPPPRDEVRAYARYVVELCRHLGRNELVQESVRQVIMDRALEYEETVKVSYEKKIEDLTDELLEKIVNPYMAHLDKAAEREVQRCVRDVMIGVTVSPWRAADLLVVVYRNMLMVDKVIAIYDVRPAAVSQLRIIFDISKVVFTVNILNYGSKLAENLSSGIPFVGRFVDDIAQGVGAGLLTSMAGHAAIERCSCIQPWDAEKVQVRMGIKAKAFASDLKGIVAEDILPRLKVRIPVDDDSAESNRMENLKGAVTRAMDQTAEAMDAFVGRPAYAAGRTFAWTGKTAVDGIRKIGAGAARGINRGASSAGHALKKGGQKVGRLFRKTSPRTKDDESDAGDR